MRFILVLVVAENGRKTIFGRKRHYDSHWVLTIGFLLYFAEIIYFLPFISKINAFFCVFYTEIQNDHKNGRKQIWPKYIDDSVLKLFPQNFIKIALSQTEMNSFLF